jgi:type I restriction enzyme S subunit
MKQDRKEKVNVPNLRFPEFEEEWKEKCIGEIAPLQRGFDLPTQNIKNGDIPIVYSNGILNYHDESKCKAPGLVTGRSGTIGKFTFINVGEYWPHNTALWVTTFHNNNPYFVYYLYQSINIEQFATGSGVPTLNRNDVHKKLSYIPALAEQKKIANLMCLIDQRIETQSKIIEDLGRLKVSLIHYYYRLQRYDNAVLLADCIIQQSKRNKNDEEYPVLSVSNKYGFIRQSEQFENREVASEDVTNYKIVRENDFAYNPARINVGSVARLRNSTSGIVSPMYVCFHTKDNLLPDFLEFYFSSQVFKDEMNKRLEGGVRQCLTFESLGNIPICFPTIEEQKAIALRLTAVQKKIDIESNIENLFIKQKKYLLNQMFI